MGEAEAMVRPAFLITIDTEGDNLWANPREVTTRNARFLPRFQELCEGYKLKPTYLTNYEMANCGYFQEFGRQALARNTAEIGMHLHAWDMPPEHSLTGDDLTHHPYLIEYPDDIMKQKIACMTDVLECTFNTKMVSHRAGRWAIDARYVRLLLERGYRVDCSITPYYSWRDNPGNPAGTGGQDYTKFPQQAYFLDLNDIAQPGTSPMLEVPLTIIPRTRPLAVALRHRYSGLPRRLRGIVNRYTPLYWLRPNGRNRDQMLTILRMAQAKAWNYVEFMLHSSEFMPGGSPTFRTAADIERLYEDLHCLFAMAQQSFRGATLKEFYHDSVQSGRMIASAGTALY
jgi:hypothetical protein